MKEDLLKIIEHFGINNQQRKLQEEMFELQEAILKYENAKVIFGKNSTLEVEHIIEEIADCLILLDQFKLYYEIKTSQITDICEDKIKRTLKRIESGYYDKQSDNS